MRENKKAKLKCNKGFLIQDLAIAILILMLLVTVVTSIYISIFKVQAETRVDAMVAIHGMRILEYIDEISYEEVTNENNLAEVCRQQFNIPQAMNLTINVSNYKPEVDAKDLTKIVKVKIKYEFQGNERILVLENLKVKEV